MDVDKADFTNENKWLADAVLVLKSKGIIKRDKELANVLGYSKVSVSNMLAGRNAISFKFKTKFEETYGEYLTSQVSEPEVSYGGERIIELKYTIEVQKDLISELKEKILLITNQKKTHAHS